jgi:glycosyltransferase involved in cell wall biosynthesis
VTAPLVTIVINNYNYGRFLRTAIESALAQTYRPLEVLVVDDGSTDDSRDIMATFGDRIIPMPKENGGQTSAMNHGFAACRGDVVLFLDADDGLLPMAVESVIGHFDDPAIVKVHWPLSIVDASGHPTGDLKPSVALSSGDLRDQVVLHGPENGGWVPTSGNAWRRAFLQRLFPLKEMEGAAAVRSASADAYLSMLAPLYGRIGRSDTPLGWYRVHGSNDHSSMEFERRLERDRLLFHARSEVLAEHCARVGLAVDPQRWREGSWFERLAAALDDMSAVVPEGEPFVLIDGDQWMTPSTVRGRRRIPFPSSDGRYWGPPASDDAAIAELTAVFASGIRFVVVAWPAFWWLDYYRAFADTLQTTCGRVADTDRIVIFRCAG